jgi:hypothetical protein
VAGRLDGIDEKLLGVSRFIQGCFLFLVGPFYSLSLQYAHPPPPPLLLSSSADIKQRPNFADIVDILDSMVTGEKDGDVKKKRRSNKFVSALIDRHSTWF